MYGLTEAGPRVTIQTLEYSTENSRGKTLKNVHVQIKIVKISLQKFMN
jgi:long-subunit acyl-CoA synthetase (AMP-forming)